MSGTGPGDHPGVTIIGLTSDQNANTSALEAVLEAGGEFLFVYSVGGSDYAVFASGYK